VKPRSFQQPVLSFGGKVPVKEHPVGVDEPCGGFAEPPFLRAASDDVHFDAGPGLGEVVGQPDDPFQTLVADQPADGDQPGKRLVRPDRTRNRGRTVLAAHAVVNELDGADPAQSAPHRGHRRLRHGHRRTPAIYAPGDRSFQKAPDGRYRPAEVRSELFVVHVVDDDRHAGAAPGDDEGCEERDAVLAVEDEVVMAAP
jgi:hypothetical protein